MEKHMEKDKLILMTQDLILKDNLLIHIQRMEF
jgi:hypothetical protein